MASKKAATKVAIEVNDVESMLTAFRLWTEMGSEKRQAMIAEKGEADKRFTLKKDKAWISFYDTGAVYVSFGKFHSIRLWSGFDPVNSYTNKAGERKDYPLTWSCDSYYSMDNVALVKALGKAF